MSSFNFLASVRAYFLVGIITAIAVPAHGQQSENFGQYRRIDPSTAVPTESTTSRTTPGQDIVLENCGAHLIDEIELSALVNGQLETIKVERGANVRAGDVIALIDETLAKIAIDESEARLELSQFQAADEVPIEAAFKEVQLRKTQFDRIVRLWMEKSIPEFEYLEKKFQHEIAELKHVNALNQRRMAEIEGKAEQAKLDAAREQLKRHSMLAPFDGQVFEIVKQRGEWVNAGEPVFRLARLDRVRIRGSVRYRDYDPHELAGREVVVSIPMARGRYVDLPGKIVFVASERISDTFEVLAEVENRQENGYWVISARHTEIIMRIKLQ